MKYFLKILRFQILCFVGLEHTNYWTTANNYRKKKDNKNRLYASRSLYKPRTVFFFLNHRMGNDVRCPRKNKFFFREISIESQFQKSQYILIGLLGGTVSVRM